MTDSNGNRKSSAEVAFVIDSATQRWADNSGWVKRQGSAGWLGSPNDFWAGQWDFDCHHPAKTLYLVRGSRTAAVAKPNVLFYDFHAAPAEIHPMISTGGPMRPYVKR